LEIIQDCPENLGNCVSVPGSIPKLSKTALTISEIVLVSPENLRNCFSVVG
jgi:hypothetical protein